MISKEKLVLDTSALGDSDNVGAYVRAADGTLITRTNVGTKEGLDVYLINSSIVVTATDLDIRDLNHTQDNVAIAQGGNTMIVNPDGSINVKADIDVVTGAEKAEDSAHSSGDIGQYVLSVRQDVLASSTSADGDYQSFKTDSLGSLWVRLSQAPQAPAFNSVLVTQNTVDATSELVVPTDLTNRRRMIIQNVSGNRTVYLGHSSGVTAANGIRLSPGASIEIDLAAGTALYAIANGAGADIRVMELAG